jgi:hypothetical protein
MELKICISDFVPPWLSPVERLAVNQSVKGSNPFGGANRFCYRFLIDPL